MLLGLSALRAPTVGPYMTDAKFAAEDAPSHYLQFHRTRFALAITCARVIAIVVLVGTMSWKMTRGLAAADIKGTTLEQEHNLFDAPIDSDPLLVMTDLGFDDLGGIAMLRLANKTPAAFCVVSGIGSKI